MFAVLKKICNFATVFADKKIIADTKNNNSQKYKRHVASNDKSFRFKNF
jgi:hypothetical protein